MAVFTQVSKDDLLETIRRFDLGEIVSLQGISAGIENTNFFLDTQRAGHTIQHWVLTVFENLNTAELPYFVELTLHLSRNGFAVPAPLLDEDGSALIDLKGKKALIVQCLKGSSFKKMSAEHCHQAGMWLANMHLALQGFKETRPLVRSLDWMRDQQALLTGSDIPDADSTLLAQLIDRYADYQPEIVKCPQGTVHGDLFRDNVLFEGDHITGVIDFYHACNASLLFDLAVCANDWAVEEDGSYHEGRLNALVSGYESQREWTDRERNLWPKFLELAALRFWISRLVSKHTAGYQQGGVVEGDTIKDPDEIKRILLFLLRFYK